MRIDDIAQKTRNEIVPVKFDENGKLVECMERNELYVKDVSIPVGNGQYTTPVDVSVIEIDRIDLLKYVP